MQYCRWLCLFNHFTPKLLRLILELVRKPNIFSCTKLEMNLVWDNCNTDVTSFARFDMQLLTNFSSKLSELELFNGSNVWKQTFRGEMVKVSFSRFIFVQCFKQKITRKSYPTRYSALSCANGALPSLSFANCTLCH